MKTVEKWKWRILWGSRWTTTKAHFTEDEIRREHPEAKRIGPAVVEQLPETDDERAAAYEAMRRPAKSFRPEP